MEKRGQITVFIILGILIVGIVGLAVYFKTIGIDFKESVVDAEVRPVKEHVDYCVKEVSLRALGLIGEQGGYTEVPLYKDTLNILNSNLQIPYWLDEDAIVGPDLKDIEKELENYIDEELKNCVDFSKFEDYSIMDGDVKSDVVVGDNVVVRVVYPIKVLKNEVEYNLDKFLETINLDLGKIYYIAKGLTITEVNENFLEEKTLQLIDGYSGVSYDKLPPMSSGLVFSCFEVNWPLSFVEENLKNILIDNIPYIQIKGTEIKRRTSRDEIEQGIYDSFIYDLGWNFPNTHIEFKYGREFDLDLNVRPNKGNIVKPKDYRFPLPLIPGCIKDYNFYYDLKYPVLIEIRDDSALNGEGYSFKFPLIVVIEGNAKRVRQLSELYQPQISFFCDEEQKISKENVFEVWDKTTGLQVFDAEVGYRCGEETCLLGETELDVIYARLYSKLPKCEGGIVTVDKEGYFTYSDRLDVGENTKVTKVVELVPLKELNVNVKKLYVEDDVVRKEDLDSGDSVFVSLERIPRGVDKLYTTSANLPDKNEVELVPGFYKATVNVIWNNELTIPRHRGCAKRVLGVCIKHYTIPEQTFRRFPIGGSEFTFVVGDEIYNNGEIEFYVFTEELPINWGEVMRLQENLDKYNENYVDYLEPKFI